MMWFLARICIGIVLVAFACGLAGLYGMAHNQISFTFAPAYFHDLKFDQFRIPTSNRNAWGAAMIGWQASWWMGGILGIALFLLGFRIKIHRIFVSAFLRSAFFVVIVTLALGVLAFTAARLFLRVEMIPEWLRLYGSNSPLEFAQAAIMHETSYLAACISLFIAMLTIQRRAVKRDQRRGFPF